VAFVADDLGAWLVGFLADAGRRKLTMLVLGTDQERALQRAATAAVQVTAAEMSPSDAEQARHLAMVISEVFREVIPDVLLTRPTSLLEGLQAGIAGQLAVLDDASLTGTGESSADVLGIPSPVLAERLTGHLVWDITVRGSGGGPLTPLADQLNHDVTHLQGQRVEGILARLADEVRAALDPPGREAVAGRPLDEVTDPFALEVHRPIQPEERQVTLPALPTYVPREHDSELGSVVRAAAEGSSGIAVLVGGSSTGKTRACWEVLRQLRERPEKWRLWHPIDPSRPDAALRELPAIRPWTVAWLNEAQFYLDVADGGVGEQVAAGLRELLRDRARSPVLVLATIWTSFWNDLISRPASGTDPHAQARELLSGHDIAVPAAFTGPQLQQLRQAGDVRLIQAAGEAHDGQVIQYLAGAPELLARYRNAPPAARALIHAAMDARNLGMRPALPYAFLEAAAPGYLTDSEWDQLAEDWLEQAVAYTAAACKGVRGPLTRIRPRLAHTAGSFSGPSTGPAYRLADYLDQHGRRTRRYHIPPASFWAAAESFADPSDLRPLGDAAHSRGLYCDAAQLYKHAAARGDPAAAEQLVRIMHRLHPTDQRPADWVAAQVDLDDPASVARLLDELRAVGARDQFTTLAGRAAADTPLDDLYAVAVLLHELRVAKASEAVTTLANRAVSHAPLHDPVAVARLLIELRAANADAQADTLLNRDAGRQAALHNPDDATELLGAEDVDQITTLEDRFAHAPPAHLDLLVIAWQLGALGAAEDGDQITVLAERAVAHAPLNDPDAIARLLGALRGAEAGDQVATLLGRDPAGHAALDDPDAVARLLGALRGAEAGDQVATLLGRDPAGYAALDDLDAVTSLLDQLQTIGARDQFSTLADRAAGQVALHDLAAVARLLGALQAGGARDQITNLADRAVAYAPLDDPYAIAALLDGLRAVGAGDQIAALLGRDPAGHAALDNPYAVSTLLGALEAANTRDQLITLAGRAAVCTPLDRPAAVVRLLGALRAAGAEDQTIVLIDRMPGAGMFKLFCDQEDHQYRFRFGRSADGHPAEGWSWEDLANKDR
jgi:hypothetical protein